MKNKTLKNILNVSREELIKKSNVNICNSNTFVLSEEDFDKLYNHLDDKPNKLNDTIIIDNLIFTKFVL